LKIINYSEPIGAPVDVIKVATMVATSRSSNGSSDGGGCSRDVCFVEQLLKQLLFHVPTQQKLHVASPSIHYRNKITYSCVREQQQQQQPQYNTIVPDYSTLAEEYINDICRTIIEFWQLHIDPKQKSVDSCDVVLLREMMVKGTRSPKGFVIRLTLQFIRNDQLNRNNNENDTDDLPVWEDGILFHDCIVERYMNAGILQQNICICYNCMIEENVRPVKDLSRLCFLTPHARYLYEYTPNGYIYQISPDTFSEVNHPVELLQWEQTKIWMEELYMSLLTPVPNYVCNSDKYDNQYNIIDHKDNRNLDSVVLIVSGRDVSSFALGFGTLTIPNTEGSKNSDHSHSNHPDTIIPNNNHATNYMFPYVIAVQHCPLVHYDAVHNIQRYQKDYGSIPNFTVLHCTKPTMVTAIRQELSQQDGDPPIVSVMTGGRKGLDPSYIHFLNHHPSMKGIIYNSCATKSLLRDMKGFIIDGGFYMDNFCSYDFLPGTGYTASLTKLKRRPRTLILLIGPAGVGKSYFAQQLVQQYSPHDSNIIWWERDRLFASMRNDGIGLAKTKQLLHQSLLDTLRKKTTNNAIIIIDSTNGNMDARKLYVQEASPDLVIYVHFQVQIHGIPNDPNANNEQVVDFLLERTVRRLQDNVDQHPSFPTTIPAQRTKHENILKGIVHPTAEELSQLPVDRSVLITCDPQDAACMATLPYKVFLEFTTSSEIRQALFI
jgi:predicted kinase